MRMATMVFVSTGDVSQRGQHCCCGLLRRSHSVSKPRIHPCWYIASMVIALVQQRFIKVVVNFAALGPNAPNWPMVKLTKCLLNNCHKACYVLMWENYMSSVVSQTLAYKSVCYNRDTLELDFHQFCALLPWCEAKIGVTGFSESANDTFKVYIWGKNTNN